MDIVGSTRSCIRFLQLIQPGFLLPAIQTAINGPPVRHRRTKHWNPQFKKLRRLKVIPVELPNFQKKREDLKPHEIRKEMKKRGVLPPRPWLERPFHISCTGGIFESYIPPEGDGKKSIISTAGAKQQLEFLEKKSKSMMAIRKIRSYEEDYDNKKFAQTALDIYIKAHNAMIAKEKYKLREFITERCYPEMMYNVKYKTVHWKFLQSLEPPRVVQARITNIITQDNLFAQVTVRFHTQQQLAIYDRFGRLMYGSEILAKDVLEYAVFEKHISNEYGLWRLHDKIVPDWLPSKEPAPITYRLIEDEANEAATVRDNKQLSVASGGGHELQQEQGQGQGQAQESSEVKVISSDVKQSESSQGRKGENINVT